MDGAKSGSNLTFIQIANPTPFMKTSLVKTATPEAPFTSHQLLLALGSVPGLPVLIR